jgi:hypothetical protein
MPSGPRRTALRWVVAAFTGYALVFVWRTSFVIDGVRYFSLFDDAMVSMRYARNLAHGFGLVWNPGGERVEGYTNLLWVLYLAGLHLLPVPAAKISLLVQLTSLVLLAANLVVVARLAGRLADGSRLASTGAAVLSASYISLNNWALQGMEVGLAALLVSLSVWLAVEALISGRFPVALYPLLGVSTLVRLDLAVPAATILLALVAFDARQRSRHLAHGAVALGLALGGQTAFRRGYYGELLPNTYYLKMTGYPALDRIGRGVFVGLQTVMRLVAGLLLLLPALRAVRWSRPTILVVLVIVAQAGYSVYVGGDAWEWAGGANRYWVIVLPLLFAVVSAGLGRLELAWAGRHRPVLVGLLGLTVISLNVMAEPSAWRVWLLDTAPLHVADNAAKIRLALKLRRITEPEATVAVVWAGAEAYFLDRVMIDILGKNDRVIAHLPMRRSRAASERWTFFYPGHLKYDYAYSIGRLRPDVVAMLWRNPEEALPYLRDYDRIVIDGQPVFLRRGSAHLVNRIPGGQE